VELWEYAILTLVGFVAGIMNVMAGGGSLLTIPVMLFFGISGPVANGTNRIAILAQSISAVVAFFRKGFSDFKISLSFSMAALLGALGGAYVGVGLEGVWFERLVASVMIIVVIVMLRKKKKGETPSKDVQDDYIPNKHQLILGYLCLIGAGFWGGLIQIGVGFILVPILHRVLGYDMVCVNMHKVFIVLVYTIGALAIFASQIGVLLSAGIALTVGQAVGGALGANLSVSKGENIIKSVYFATLGIFIVKLLFFS
jgi:uncharacterized membrane protein YfcA